MRKEGRAEDSTEQDRDEQSKEALSLSESHRAQLGPERSASFSYGYLLPHSPQPSPSSEDGLELIWSEENKDTLQTENG